MSANEFGVPAGQSVLYRLTLFRGYIRFIGFVINNLSGHVGCVVVDGEKLSTAVARSYAYGYRV